MPIYSRRTDWEFTPNELSEAVAARRRDGLPLFDWTLSNPTVAGFVYPEREILEALARPGSLRYDPDPRGMLSAREAVAASLSESGAPVSSGELLLTASSSESYSHLFRLLADPGGEILVPKPGYPLFDDLARLNDVRTVPYRLVYDGSWHIDRESLRRGVGERTRAIVVIHPGNPTGSYISADDREFLGRLSSERGIPILSDEVFHRFHFSEAAPPESFLRLRAPLLFVLGGLSKMAGLPQLKLGWVAVAGEEGEKRKAMARLEMIGDTYLSVNTPVQRALPEILRVAPSVSEAIRSRALANYLQIRSACEGTPASCLGAEGGWNAVLRVPGQKSDEAWGLELLRHRGLLTYPGHFFELEGGTYLVVSLIVSPEETSRNLRLLLDHLAAH